MLVGNDIINLIDAYATKKENNQLWLNKVFSPIEQSFIFSSEHPRLRLWQLWSCKESAYKVLVKKLKRRFSNAKSLTVIPSEIRGYFDVIYGEYKLVTRSEIRSKYIHTICIDPFTAIDSIVSDTLILHDLSQEEGSVAIRNKLVDSIVLVYGNGEHLFSKSLLGVPTIESTVVDIDISFSHDEPYYAFAYIPRKATVVSQ